MQQWRLESPAMTFEEVSMERSKSFVKALQELKNLRPQLYSAAEYCEKSYLCNEQKQIVLLTIHSNTDLAAVKVHGTLYIIFCIIWKLRFTFYRVLDNLKDYAIRALVNAVDHLGTVAYKLNDLFEQQISDVSTVDLKISSLNQQILACQNYTDKEGLRQQQLFAISPRHHKHYILPNSLSKKLHGVPPVQDANQNHIQAKPRPHPPGTAASKTLSWHLALEGNSASNGTLNAPISNEDVRASRITPQLFNLLDAEGAILPSPQSTNLQMSTGITSDVGFHRFGTRDHAEISKSLAAFRSFDNPRREICRPPVRSKSMLAAFFSKNKHVKQKKAIAL